MFNEGMTFSEIAEARNLSQSTIETHLSSYVISGELEIDNIVAKAKQKRIRTAVTTYGNSSLKVLKENLPSEISYGEIKMVLASMQSESAEQ
jgi:ATP-dependent DNA helicase RecQ